MDKHEAANILREYYRDIDENPEPELNVYFVGEGRKGVYKIT